MIDRHKLDVLVERVIKRLMKEMMADTIPASQSADEKAANAELAGKMTRNPKAPPMSQKNIKLNAVKKALDTMGYTNTADKAKRVTQALPGWMNNLDPADSLVSTADELAKRFASEG
jgi:hypothetical protein